MEDEIARGVVRRYFGQQPEKPVVELSPEERAGQFLRMNQTGWTNLVKAKGFGESVRWRREREAEARRLGML